VFYNTEGSPDLQISCDKDMCMVATAVRIAKE
jgi:hypothetical protein